MQTIDTSTGSIELFKTDPSRIEHLRSILPFGLLPLMKNDKGVEYGIVMQCGQEELYCLKQQPLEISRDLAEQQFRLHQIMIAYAYGAYIELGLEGLYLAAPYLRQRENELWESGVTHFIYTDDNPEEQEEIKSNSYGERFSPQATDMLLQFNQCFKNAFTETELPMPQYFGLDERSQSQVGHLGLEFLCLGRDMYYLRPGFVDSKDIVWSILASKGVEKVYLLPSIMVSLREDHLPASKGTKKNN